jgi:hypothetical protein
MRKGLLLAIAVSTPVLAIPTKRSG